MSGYHAIAGGSVDELGQTTDPRDLILGDRELISETFSRMHGLGFDLSCAAEGLSAIEIGDWTGAAGDAFRQRIAGKPAQWRDLGNGFYKIAESLAEYLSVLDKAQTDAATAITRHAEAQKATDQAITDHNNKVTTYNATISMGRDPGTPPTFVDPGQKGREEAQALLDDARGRVERAGHDTARVITEWTGKAPAEPDAWDRFAADTSDTIDFLGTQTADAVAGVGDALGEMVKLSRSINPLDPYNALHPGDYLDNMTTLGKGLAHGVTHPTELVGTLLDLETWKDSPGRALGKLLPDVVVGALSGGTAVAGNVGGKVGAAVGREAMETAGTVGRRGAVDLGRAAADGHTATQLSELGTRTGGLSQRISDLATSIGSKGETRVSSTPSLPPGPPVRQPPRVGGTTPPPPPPSTPVPSMSTAPVHTPPQVGRATPPPTQASVPDAPRVPTRQEILEQTTKAHEQARPPSERRYLNDALERYLAEARAEKPHVEVDEGRYAADARQREHAAALWVAEHGGTLEQAREANRFQTVDADGRFSGVTLADTEPPTRPEVLSSDYLNKIIEQRPDLGQYGGGPGHAPGAWILPDGLTREIPPDALSHAAVDVDPTAIQLGETGMPVVWRDEPDWLRPEQALYRLDDRPAQALFGSTGFEPRNPDNLRIGSNGTAEGYVSFGKIPEQVIGQDTRMLDGHATPIRMDDGTYSRVQYMYEAYHPSGIDTAASHRNMALESPVPPGQVLFPGGLSNENVYRAWPRITRFDVNGKFIESVVHEPIINPRFPYAATIARSR